MGDWRRLGIIGHSGYGSFGIFHDELRIGVLLPDIQYLL